jgi:hypothetical protein
VSTPESRPPSSGQRGNGSGMRPTNPATLVIAAVVTGALGWLIFTTSYGSLPKLPWLPAVSIFALAVVEAVMARTTKARIEHKPGAARVDPLSVARFVVLAKASALAGALIAGAYAGILLYLLTHRQLTAATDDTPAAVAGLVSGVALVVAGLLLERACRVPPRPDDDETT